MKKISYLQLSILLMLCFLVLNFMSMPSVMYGVAKQDSWIVVLFWMILDGLIVIPIMYMMRDAGAKNLSEYLQKLLGKIGAKVVLIILLAGLGIQLLNVLKESYDYAAFDLFENMNWILFALPLVAVIGAVAYKGIRPIARSAQVLVILIIFGVVFISLGGLIKVFGHTAYLPILQNGVAPLAKAALYNNAWFGSATFMFLLFGQVDFSTAKKRYIFWGIVISIVVTQLLLYVFYGLFQVTAKEHYFALSDISQASSTTSSLYRLQWLVVALWVIEQLGYCSLLLYCGAKCIQYIFGLKKSTVPIYILMGVALAWMYALKSYQNVSGVFNTLPIAIISVAFSTLVPLVLILVRGVRRRAMANETNKTK